MSPDRPFVPEGFRPPTHFAVGEFHLEPLGPQHNDSDYAAWTSSIDYIRSLPGYPDGRWPREMSLEENRGDLERHAGHFAEGMGFTYTVLNPGETVVGCLYIYPSKDGAYDTRVQSWLRESDSSREQDFRRAIADWLMSDAWPFEHPLYEPFLD